MSNLRQRRVLVVDDDPDLLAVLADRLRLMRFEVECADDGEEALRMLHQEPAPITLLDLQLPGISGLDVLKRVRREGIDTTVIVITAWGTAQRAVEAMGAGAYDFIPKPLDPAHVADGGTLFLDEIGDLRPALQAKLLRLLQEQEFERVGGIRPIRVDVRFIAATNTDLEGLLSRGAFRQDLYYRLKVVTVMLPPLRARKDDLEILARHFIEKYSAELKRPPKPTSPEAAALLAHYDWPGNVRELENAIERAVTLSTDSEIGPHDLPILEPIEDRAADRAGAGTYHDAVSQFKQQLLRDTLARANGNQTRAAEALGLQRTYLARLLKEYGINSQ